jgi:uncharacterized protein YjbI with pentapeptide repeats
LRGATLDGADIQGGKLSKAVLERAQLNGVTLNSVNFDAADLRGAHLSNVQGQSASGQGADFTQAQLSVVDFSHAALTDASFDGARLENVNFKEAKVGKASFRNTLFVRCDLSDVDLTHAQFDGARFEEVRYDLLTRWPDGIQPPKNAAEEAPAHPELPSQRYNEQSSLTDISELAAIATGNKSPAAKKASEAMGAKSIPASLAKLPKPGSLKESSESALKINKPEIDGSAKTLPGTGVPTPLRKREPTVELSSDEISAMSPPAIPKAQDATHSEPTAPDVSKLEEIAKSQVTKPKDDVDKEEEAKEEEE